MLTKNDLELYRILDSEIDKTLSEWCCCIFNTDYNHTYTMYINYTKWSIIKLIHKDVKYDHIFTSDIIRWTIHFRNDIFQYLDILWHYPTTNTILRYARAKKIELSVYQHNRFHLVFDYFDKDSKCWDNYELDITKEIKDYTEEQKEKLILFLKSIYHDTTNIM